MNNSNSFDDTQVVVNYLYLASLKKNIDKNKKKIKIIIFILTIFFLYEGVQFIICNNNDKGVISYLYRIIIMLKLIELLDN
jgi:hypothetical protein